MIGRWRDKFSAKRIFGAGVFAALCAVPALAAYAAPKAGSIQERLAAAAAGDVVALGKGLFKGPLVVPAGVTLEGAGAGETTVSLPLNVRKPVITLSSRSKLRNLTVEGGHTGIEARNAGDVVVENVLVRATARYGLRFFDSTATVRNSLVEARGKRRVAAGVFASGGMLKVENSIVRGWEDGAHFDPNRPTRIAVERCVFDADRDGIDLESTSGWIAECSFSRNRDDGIDIDGDSSCTITRCVIADSRDDGIEIRLERKTNVVVERCSIARSGEDAIEVISTPRRRGPFENHVLVSQCTIAQSARYGIGLSDHATEQANPAMSFPVEWRNVVFSGNKKADIAPHK